MHSKLRIVAVAALAVCATAHGEQRFNVSLAGLADDESGRSTDLDLGFIPNANWSFEGGIGSTRARSDLARIDGQSLRAGIDLHSERFGIRTYYRSWSDSSNFDTDTLGARLSMSGSGMTFSIIGEKRGFDVDYTTGSVLSPTRSTARFDGTGYGAGLSYAAAGWAGYVEGLFYNYSDLNRYTTATSAPNLLGIPLVGGLTGSVVTLKQGALDHQLNAGLERSFQRSSLRFDWSGVEDEASSAKSNTFSGTYRYSFTNRVSVGLTAGVTDSDFGSVNFAGLSFGIGG